MPTLIVKMRDREGLQACCATLRTKKKPFRSFHSIPALVMSVQDPGAVSEWIDPELIERIDEDMTVSLIRDETVEGSPDITAKPWGLQRIGATHRRIPAKYPRPKVAVIDTGIASHPALNVLKKTNVSGEKRNTDLNGHGTHIAGILAGKKIGRKSRFHGVFPGLPLYSVKAFTKDGNASLSRVMQALDWCIRKKMNIVNMSFGMNQHHPALYETIQAARDRGIVLVSAAGNDGNPGLKYPARYPEVVSVGSIDRNDRISRFSQFGAYLDVVAPGEEIVSTWKGSAYHLLSGTSMAAAHVSGVLALVLAARPLLNADECRDLLRTQAERLPTSDLLQGSGLVSWTNMINALRG